MSRIIFKVAPADRPLFRELCNYEIEYDDHPIEMVTEFYESGISWVDMRIMTKKHGFPPFSFYVDADQDQDPFIGVFMGGKEVFAQADKNGNPAVSYEKGKGLNQTDIMYAEEYWALKIGFDLYVEMRG